MTTPGTSSVTATSPAGLDCYQQAVDFLYARLNYERTPDAAGSLQDFKLARMEELLAELGNPQLAVRTVHIAGSKGKGSTATMVARIVEAAGYRVGLFTSPHVDHFEERFTVNSQIATPQQVIALVDRLRPVVERLDQRYLAQGPTFFELATALSWLHFVEQKVDLAVMEVGLGGRLDSTNVCSPLVTAITSISRDHTRLLGDTLEAIAREKAGIIKRCVPVVTGVTAAGPAQAISEIAHSQSAPLLRLGHEIQLHAERAVESTAEPACYQIDLDVLGRHFRDLSLSMSGEHQTRNAAVAVTMALLLGERGFQISEAQIRAGLLAAQCPLRVEVVDRQPLTIVDAGHNAASIEALCQTLGGLSVRRKTVLFATSRDKEVDVLLSILTRHFDEIWLTRYSNNPRAVTLDELEALAPQVLTKPWRMFANPRDALETAAATVADGDLFCITGSFFLAAEAKHLLADGLRQLQPRN
ncbi:bifunctional folylpolyglutamate synthase/dihydrofolate synthase [Planctomicrobium piriforme]|uniref:bifunctional folylpolyglutamate synthase/dihydrofolate synthase n=1 Tax=Planctomicrobium piriforme TaxID=1576369 RepID=UPI000B848B42|nr:folylpolyglutamate synthase/dihydrofolate synthase family protein [Planctomicrobium piriforme]